MQSAVMRKIKIHSKSRLWIRNFLFSGIQNKVQQYFDKTQDPAETAAFTLRCISGAVLRATLQALEKYPGLPVVFSGGVASNSMLRELVTQVKPIFSEPQYATDNAMGVAVLAYRMTEE